MISLPRFVPLFLTGILLAVAGPAYGQSEENEAAAEEAAQAAAETWLELIDAEDYGKSWDAAGSLLQTRIAREEWVKKVMDLKDRVQQLSDRGLEVREYRDSISHAPREGPFVLLKYHSSYDTGRYEELLLTYREQNEWTVGGYQVTPLRDSSAHASGQEPDMPRP